MESCYVSVVYIDKLRDNIIHMKDNEHILVVD